MYVDAVKERKTARIRNHRADKVQDLSGFPD